MKISEYLRQKRQRPINMLIKKLEDSEKRGYMAQVNKAVTKRAPKKVLTNQDNTK